MTMIALLCGFFFFGYLLFPERWQAIGFLVIGAGYQAFNYPHYLMGDDSAANTGPMDEATAYAMILLVALASVMGFIAWLSSRKWLQDGRFGKTRILIFLGYFVNFLLATWLLWLSGTIGPFAP